MCCDVSAISVELQLCMGSCSTFRCRANVDAVIVLVVEELLRIVKSVIVA